MIRSDLIAVLAARFPNLMAKDAEVSIKEILDAIRQSLQQGKRAAIRCWFRRSRASFKAGKELGERIEQSREIKTVLLRRQTHAITMWHWIPLPNARLLIRETQRLNVLLTRRNPVFHNIFSDFYPAMFLALFLKNTLASR